MPEGQKLQFRKKILLFSVFLLISVFIWLLNALSKSYSSELEFPISYVEMPEDRIFAGDPPDHLDLKVNANGYSLFQYKVFRRPNPIEFRLASFTMNHQVSGGNRAYILTRYVRDQVSSQLPSKLQLLEIRPDTLFFQFARRTSRKLPLKPALSFEFDRQVTLMDGIALEPDSVMVSGPDVVVDTMSHVSTVKVDLGLLSRDFNQSVDLDMLGDLEYEIQAVECKIVLERITEVQLQVPVTVSSLPDSLEIQTFPSSVKLTCTVGLSKYELLENHPIEAVADFSMQSGNQENELRVEVQHLPAYLLSFDYYPKTIEFLTTRK